METERAWPKVARCDPNLLERIAGSAQYFCSPSTHRCSRSGNCRRASNREYIFSWAPDEAAKRLHRAHLTRFEKTLAITPRGCLRRSYSRNGLLSSNSRPRCALGWVTEKSAVVTTDRRGPLTGAERSSAGEEFYCDIDLLMPRRIRFLTWTDIFRRSLCCELVEHLAEDPMHMMAEINRHPSRRVVI